MRPESLSTQLSVMAGADQRDLLPRIAVPTLLIWGEFDARSPLRVARQFEQAIPDTKLVVIPRAGHVSHLDQPEQFNQAVREFCRAHSQASTNGSDGSAPDTFAVPNRSTSAAESAPGPQPTSSARMLGSTPANPISADASCAP